jgi:hypothetical protein
MKPIMKPLGILFGMGLIAGSAYADQSYRITLSSISRIGGIEFKPGEYRLVVDAPKVSFTSVSNGKVVEVEANVHEADTKSEHTAIHSTSVDGVAKVFEIRFSGSKTHVAFD